MSRADGRKADELRFLTFYNVPNGGMLTIGATGEAGRAIGPTGATGSTGATGATARTSRVFCAVIAVIALVPWTPQLAKAFRSAWIPAPPPESEPAIVSATGVRAPLTP